MVLVLVLPIRMGTVLGFGKYKEMSVPGLELYLSLQEEKQNLFTSRFNNISLYPYLPI